LDGQLDGQRVFTSELGDSLMTARPDSCSSRLTATAIRGGLAPADRRLGDQEVPFSRGLAGRREVCVSARNLDCRVLPIGASVMIV